MNASPIESDKSGSTIKMPKRNPDDLRQKRMAQSILGRCMEMDQSVTDEEIVWALMVTGDYPPD